MGLHYTAKLLEPCHVKLVHFAGAEEANFDWSDHFWWCGGMPRGLTFSDDVRRVSAKKPSPFIQIFYLCSECSLNSILSVSTSTL